jgi:hypothetical protein
MALGISLPPYLRTDPHPTCIRPHLHIVPLFFLNKEMKLKHSTADGPDGSSNVPTICKKLAESSARNSAGIPPLNE